MVVSMQAIEEFRNRTLCDSSKAKKFTRKALLAKIAKLDPQPKFHTKCWTHQLACFLIGLKYPGYVFLLDMGTGKTKVTVDLFSYRKMTGAAKRMLVCVPYGSNVGAWLEQLEIHAPSLKVVGLSGDRNQREAGLADETADVVVVTYMGLLSLVCDRMKGSGLSPSEKKINAVSKHFDFIAFDESTAIKNPRALTFRVCRKIAKKMKFAYALTGTPHGRDPSDMWAQFNAVDGGATLGTTLGIFRGAYFTVSKDWFAGDVYTFNTRYTDEVARVMRHRSIRYSASECQDLPKYIPSVRNVVFPAETWEYYDRLMEDLKEAKGDFTGLQSAFTNLRMLTSGYLPYIDPEGEKQYIVFKQNPKMDAFTELVQEMGDEQIVVFNIYKKTGELICDALKKLKIKHVRLFSGTKQKSGVVEKFKSGKAQVLVSSESGAFGLNLQTCSKMIFFEVPASPIVFSQMKKRCHRGGQQRAVNAYYLTVKNSVDEKILEYQAEGKNLFDALVEGKSL